MIFRFHCAWLAVDRGGGGGGEGGAQRGQLLPLDLLSQTHLI